MKISSKAFFPHYSGKQRLKGSGNAPLSFVLVAGVGFEPTTPGCRTEIAFSGYVLDAAKMPSPQPLRWQTAHTFCGYRAFPLVGVEFVLP